MQREVEGAGVAKPEKGREQGGEDSEDSKKHPNVDTLGIQPQITASSTAHLAALNSLIYHKARHKRHNHKPPSGPSTRHFLPVPYVSHWTPLLSKHPRTHLC